MSGRGIWKRTAAWILAAAMVWSAAAVTGCGQAKNGEEAGSEGKTGNDRPAEEEMAAAGAENGTEPGDTEKVMGRYLEHSDETLKGELATGSCFAKTEDGKLVLMSGNAGKWVSADNGTTWEKEAMPWHEEMMANGVWILNSAVSKDGSIAVIYAGGDSEEDDGGDSGQEEEISFHPKYGMAAPDGTFTRLDIPYKDMEYVSYFAFGEDGRLFGSAMGGKVYEIDRETGSCKEIIELPATAHYLTESNGQLLLVHGDGVTVVDLATGEVLQDDVLEEFVGEQFGAHVEYASEGVQPLLLLADGDGAVYLIFEKGIYRHVIGGNVIEQVMDGSLTSLRDPSYGISDGILLENEEFLLVFSAGEMMRYTYDPDTPAVPDVRLKAYSLRESQQMKTVIAAFQAEHPEVYVEYEIGMEENSSVGREDALKKLNTEIAAGKGPDFFLLDDMPIDSYMEKGVLMDLAPYLEDKTEEEYFGNVLYAFRKEQGTFVVPSQFKPALIAGKQAEIAKVTDLESMALAMEAYRQEHPEGAILGSRSEEEMLETLMPVCAPAWKGEDGKTDQAALTEFYTLAKRVWDAEDAGITDEMREEYEKWLEDMETSGISRDSMRKYSLSVSSKMIGYLSGERVLVAGTLLFDDGLDMISSSFRFLEEEDGAFAAYNGQSEGVFVPGNLMGISQTSPYQDMAVQLMDSMLDHNSWEGMSVNRKEWEESLRANVTEDGSAYASIGGGSSDGSISYHLELYAASEEDIDKLREISEKAHTPYVRDAVLEDAVCETGVKVLRGEISPSAGVEEVMQKTAIYMAE